MLVTKSSRCGQAVGENSTTRKEMIRDKESFQKIQTSCARVCSSGRCFRIHRVIHSQQRKGDQLHRLVHVLHYRATHYLLVRVLRVLGL